MRTFIGALVWPAAAWRSPGLSAAWRALLLLLVTPLWVVWLTFGWAGTQTTPGPFWLFWFAVPIVVVAAWPSLRRSAASAQEAEQRKLAEQTIMVKTYRDAKAYAQDAQKMGALGWHPSQQSAVDGHINVGRTAAKVALFSPLALVTGASRSKGQITVTWERQLPASSVE